MTVNLSSLGWDAGFAEAYRPHHRPDVRPARVVRVDRGICTNLTAAGAVRANLGGDLLHRSAADPVEIPCAGDWVVLRTWPDERTTVEAVLPRRTAVVRSTVGKQSAGQVLAANLDAAAVVEPLDPEPDLGRIERLLSLAWDCGAPPLIILTKADLLADPDAIAAEVSEIAPNVPVYTVSTRKRTGLDPLRPRVAAGLTLGLLGVSGAGKSTLVNALVGAAVMGTRTVRGDGRGKHTTTYRALVPIPGGGAVLDTPGLRQVGMFDSRKGLDQTFGDLVSLASRCRFAGCTHVAEPGCAVIAAVAAGDLPPRRLASWRKLVREQAYEAHRRTTRLRAEARSSRSERLRRARP